MKNRVPSKFKLFMLNVDFNSKKIIIQLLTTRIKQIKLHFKTRLLQFRSKLNGCFKIVNTILIMLYDIINNTRRIAF